MSSHYLIDLFSTIPTVSPPASPPYSGAPIIAVDDPANGQSLVNGTFVVKLPDSIPLVDPVTLQPSTPNNLGDLIAKKYQGLLSIFASSGYTNVTFDSLLDSSGIASITSGGKGQKGTCYLNSGATFTSDTITLATSTSNAVFTWEIFTYIDSDPANGRYTRTYNELTTSPSYTTAQISVDGGGTYTTVTDLTPTTLVAGSSLIVKITNVSSSKLYLGAWALVY